MPQRPTDLQGCSTLLHQGQEKHLFNSFAPLQPGSLLSLALSGLLLSSILFLADPWQSGFRLRLSTETPSLTCECLLCLTQELLLASTVRALLRLFPSSCPSDLLPPCSWRMAGFNGHLRAEDSKIPIAGPSGLYLQDASSQPSCVATPNGQRSTQIALSLPQLESCWLCVSRPVFSCPSDVTGHCLPTPPNNI